MPFATRPRTVLRVYDGPSATVTRCRGPWKRAVSGLRTDPIAGVVAAGYRQRWCGRRPGGVPSGGPGSPAARRRRPWAKSRFRRWCESSPGTGRCADRAGTLRCRAREWSASSSTSNASNRWQVAQTAHHGQVGHFGSEIKSWDLLPGEQGRPPASPDFGRQVDPRFRFDCSLS